MTSLYNKIELNFNMNMISINHTVLFLNLIIIIIIGIYIAPFPFIKCSKVLHIVIVRVIVNKASMGEPEKVCFETLLEGLNEFNRSS